MSTKEMIYSMIEEFTDEQLKQVFTMLTSVKKMLDAEAEDDAFCQKLLDDYLSDPDPDKHDSISIEELAAELEIDLNEI